jgi:hypothetical protein
VDGKMKFEVVPVAEVFSTKLENLQANAIAVDLADRASILAANSNTSADGKDLYEIRGLRSGHKAWIVRNDEETWNLLRENNSGEIEWLGKYSTINNALNALSNMS